MMVAERFAILICLIAAFSLGIALWRLFQRRRLHRLYETDVPTEVSSLIANGKRALLYFTTDQCTQCRFQQTPLLRELIRLTDVAVHTIDAAHETHLARHYGVMTVPTTVLLDQHGRPVAVNHGVTTLQQLQQQVSETT